MLEGAALGVLVSALAVLPEALRPKPRGRGVQRGERSQTPVG
jgi:hypothetical protein